mmetsp:Transcript_17837/g.46583  ORF Transcript_17837/g.46583 Transcript_17837/m.46583 type:complete len:300 (+) Transcript_17837:1071-1970(+)
MPLRCKFGLVVLLHRFLKCRFLREQDLPFLLQVFDIGPQVPNQLHMRIALVGYHLCVRSRLFLVSLGLSHLFTDNLKRPLQNGNLLFFRLQLKRHLLHGGTNIAQRTFGCVLRFLSRQNLHSVLRNRLLECFVALPCQGKLVIVLTAFMHVLHRLCLQLRHLRFKLVDTPSQCCHFGRLISKHGGVLIFNLTHSGGMLLLKRQDFSALLFGVLGCRVRPLGEHSHFAFKIGNLIVQVSQGTTISISLCLKLGVFSCGVIKFGTKTITVSLKIGNLRNKRFELVDFVKCTLCLVFKVRIR